VALAFIDQLTPSLHPYNTSQDITELHRFLDDNNNCINSLQKDAGNGLMIPTPKLTAEFSDQPQTKYQEETKGEAHVAIDYEETGAPPAIVSPQGEINGGSYIEMECENGETRMYMECE
jgi:hypothetical protein